MVSGRQGNVCHPPERSDRSYHVLLRKPERSEGMKRFPPSRGETCLSCLVLVLLPGVLVLLILRVMHYL